MPLQPKDYLLQLPDPNEAFRRQIETAMGVAQIQQRNQLADIQQQELALKAQEAQRKAAVEQAMQDELADVAANPTTRRIAQAMVRFPDKASELRAAHEAYATEEQSARLSLAQRTYAAMQNEAPDAALSVIGETKTAYRNSGREQDAKALEAIEKLIPTNPNGAKASMGMFLASVMGPDKFVDVFEKLSLLGDKQREGAAKATTAEAEAKYAQPRQAAELGQTLAGAANQRSQVATRAAELDLKRSESAATIKNINSQIADRTAGQDIAKKKLELDEKKLEAEAEKALRDSAKLEPDARKEVNEAGKAVLKSNAIAQKAGELASRFKKIGTTSGFAGWTAEKIKAFLGSQGGESELRQQFNQIINSEVLRSLPPGTASDRDIEIARGGFPTDLSNPELIASALRGIEKIAKAEAGMNRAMVRWISANGSLGTATRAFKVGDVQVQPGDDFEVVQSTFVPKAAPAQAAAPENLPPEVAAGLKRLERIEAAVARKKGGGSGGR